MVDQCDGCTFYRQRYYEAMPVGECRISPPTTQGKHMQWPEVLPDDWCGEFEAQGSTLGATYIHGEVSITTTAPTKLMDVAGDTIFTVVALFGCQIGNTSGQAVQIFFFDGNTTNLITQLGCAANGSNQVDFVLPPVATSGEIWCAASTALATIYIAAQGLKVKP